MLLVLSPNSVGSDAVERELSVAADNNKRVVPILLHDCELPIGFEYELAGVQRIDFSETTYPDALDRLATQLRRIGSSVPSTAMMPPPAAPPPAPPPPAPFVERKPPLARHQTRIVLGATAVVVLAAVLVPLALSDPALSDQERAEAVVMEWAEATSLRDWASVDRIDPIGLDEPYETRYGSPKDSQRMESIHPYFLVSKESDAGMWTIIGAVAVYDYRPDSDHPDGFRTNFVCSIWQVDMNLVPTPTSHWQSLQREEEFDHLVNPADFAITHARTCLGR